MTHFFAHFFFWWMVGGFHLTFFPSYCVRVEIEKRFWRCGTFFLKCPFLPLFFLSTTIFFFKNGIFDFFAQCPFFLIFFFAHLTGLWGSHHDIGTIPIKSPNRINVFGINYWPVSANDKKLKQAAAPQPYGQVFGHILAVLKIILENYLGGFQLVKLASVNFY